MNYILFIIQESNFQSRSLLVPAEKFLSVRKEEYEMLERNARKMSFKEGTVDKVILINWTVDPKHSHIFFQDADKEYSEFYSDLCSYADWSKSPEVMGGIVYQDKKDLAWIPQKITDFCGGFNHVKNFLDSMKLKVCDGKNINIVDGILFLQTRDGILEKIPYDTVDEMMEDTYGFKPSDFKNM